MSVFVTIIFVALFATVIVQQNQISRIKKNEDKRLHEKYCGSGKAVDLLNNNSNDFFSIRTFLYF